MREEPRYGGKVLRAQMAAAMLQAAGVGVAGEAINPIPKLHPSKVPGTNTGSHGGHATQVPNARNTRPTPKGTDRNAPCPCGSGKKAKKCDCSGFVPRGAVPRLVEQTNPADYAEPLVEPYCFDLTGFIAAAEYCHGGPFPPEYQQVLESYHRHNVTKPEDACRYIEQDIARMRQQTTEVAQHMMGVDFGSKQPSVVHYEVSGSDLSVLDQESMAARQRLSCKVDNANAQHLNVQTSLQGAPSSAAEARHAESD